MRTTVDISDELFRSAKREALARDCTLKDLFTDALVHELEGHAMSGFVGRHPLPAIRLPDNAPILNMSPSGLAEVDNNEEVSRHDLGRH